MDLISKIKKYWDIYIDMLSCVETTENNNHVNFDKWSQSVLNIFNCAKDECRNLFLIGNGASCSMASHLAVDFTKNGGINSFSINEGTLLTCFSNDFSYETAYLEILKRKMNNADVLIAISSSGKSKNIINAVDFIRKNYKDSPIITFNGFKNNNPLNQMGNYNLYLPAEDYGMVESGHAYYLHLLIDLFVKMQQE